MKKILSKIASAGTIALLGYEVGNNVHESHSHELKENISLHENHDMLIIIILIIVCIIMIVFARIMIKKRRVI